MKAVYFASVRERIGLTEEEIFPPAGVATVAELIGWLSARGEGYAAAFANAATIRAAIDRNPRAAGFADRSRARDRLFPADDRGLK